MQEHEPEHAPAPALEVEERSVIGTIGTLAVGFGLGYATDLGKLAAQETVETIKDVIRPSDDTPEIVLPPGVNTDDE